MLRLLLALPLVPPTAGPVDVVARDLDGDGTPEVVLVTDGELRLVTVTPTGSRDASWRLGPEPPTGVDGVQVVDVDGDGRLDLLAHGEDSPGHLLLQTVDGSFLEGVGVDLGGARRVTTPDLDGDGALDLVVSSRDEQRLYRRSAAGGLVPLTSIATGSSVLAGRSGKKLALECAKSLKDEATGACVTASSVPLAGSLYPLGPEWMIDVAGRVGIGTMTPAAQLHVIGDVEVSGPASASTLESRTTSGPPLVVHSSVRVDGLNADRLDGLEASAFSQLGGSIESGEIADKTIVDDDVALNAAIAGTKIDPDFGSQPVETTSTGRFKALDLTLTSGAPLTVASTTRVPNLNADLLDGFTATDFSTFGTAVDWYELANGAVRDVHVSPIAAIDGKKIAPDFGSQDVVTTGSGDFGHAKVAATGTHAVEATTDGASKMALRGTASSAGFAWGVYGQATGKDAVGVEGVATLASAAGEGVRGRTYAPDGIGVRGIVSNQEPSSFATGVLGESPTGIGVHGRLTNGMFSTSSGVRGTVGTAGIGVFGEALGSSLADGVRGDTFATSGYAVYANARVAGAIGLYADAAGPGEVAVYANGDLTVTGNKNFVQPHPTDPSKELRFVCLEGNESGTYFRGSARLEGGVAVIEVPEEFRLVSAEDGLTVQLTSVGAPARLWVESLDLEHLVVRGDLDGELHYFVNGVRRGFEEHRAIAPNRAFRPRFADRPFGTALRPELREDLVRSGVLRADYTPDPTTAAALGWELRDSGE